MELGEKESKSAIVSRVVERANELWTYWRPNIIESETDRDMAAGQQWPQDIALLRKGRVTLTVNKLPQFIERIMGDMRQNPTSIKYRAKQYNSGKKYAGQIAGAEYTQAEVREAIAKEIEDNSNAVNWYDRAATQMVTGAMGYLRVDVVADKNGQPKLEIGGVLNPSLVLIDYAGTAPDYSEARDGFIFTPIPRREFIRRWPDSSVVDISYPQGYQGLRWVLEQQVMTAEYWERDPDTGQVVWRRFSGNDILDGGEEGIPTPFDQISIIPMFGRESTLSNGYRQYESAHRHARDAMRDSNYWRSAMTEMVALQPKQARIATAAQVENNRTAWETANVSNPALLTYDADPNAPPPHKEQPPDVPVAIMQIYQTCMNDLRESIGMYSQSSGNVRGDESGRAILAKERQDDTGLYVFTQSRDRAVRRVGILLQQGIKAVYTQEMNIKIMAEDDSVDHVTINGQGVDGAAEEMEDFDCYVEAGPSYATQRIEATNALMDMAKAMPDTMALGADIIADNMDFPGSDRLASRIRRSMDPKYLTANELEALAKDQQNAPPPPPDQNAMMMQAIEAAKQAQKEAQVMIEQLKVQQKQIEAQSMQASVDADAKIRNGVADAIAEYIASTGQQQQI